MPQAIGAYSVIEPNRPGGRPTDRAEVSPGEYGRHNYLGMVMRHW
jgi:hypothetical protein